MNAPRLQDRYHRLINYLRVSVTDRCNLRCAYCMPEHGVEPLRHDQILSYEEILRVARIAVAMGIRKIRVTGGEPLVRRGIVEFVARLAALPSLDDLCLTTNGILLAEAAPELKRAGLRRVNVSLDTLREERFQEITRRTGLARVLQGLEEARRVGLSPVKVNVVAMRGLNGDEVLDFARFAREFDYEVRFIEFMPADSEHWDEARVLTAREILDVVRTRYPLEPVPNGNPAGPCRSFRLPGAGKIGVISPMSDHFCGTCNRLRLTAEGRLRSCLFSDRETDLRALLRASGEDEAVAQAIREAVAHKPQGHRLDQEQRHKCGLSMSRVGG
ncbi:MAG: GTP 3',8-cyclase MoaA [Deferrisomatales bacterium]